MREEEPGSPEIGSVGEEAAKLFAALSEWGAQNKASSPAAGESVGSGSSSVWGSLNEHLATGGEDCRYCPVCQVIHLVRETSPEVKEHLSVAATSLFQAAAGFLATQTPSPPSGAEETGAERVEKIDLTDEESWDQ